MIYSCNSSDEASPQTWNAVEKGWEKTISYNVSDEKTAEIINFIDNYNKEYAQGASYEPNTPAEPNEGDPNWGDDNVEVTPPFSCNAAEVVNYSPGLRNNGSPIPDDRNDPAKALGVPQNNDTINFVSLGFGGSLIVKFDNRIFNGEGNDLFVKETSYGNPTCSGYPEYVEVSASQDGENFVVLGTSCQDGEFDLGDLIWAKYIKFTDKTNPDDFNVTVDGYDVDGMIANCIDDNQNIDDLISCDNDWMVPNGEPGEGCECSDELDSLEVDITVEYQNPNAPSQEGYPGYWMGTTVNYIVNIKNNSSENYHHLEVSALFEYESSGELLAGEPVQLWEDVNIPAGETLALEDTYFLSYDNIPTFFQTHVMVRKFSGRCTSGAVVYNNPQSAVLYDPIQ